MLDLLDSGRTPRRADLAAWCEVDGAVQLALPGLLGGATSDAPNLDAFRRRATLLRAGLERLLRVMPEQPDPDVSRAALLLEVQRRHPGARIIAFSQYVETVRRLGRLLAGAPRVAQLTARGARIASGPVPRAFVLEQFAPGRRSRSGAVDRIELLLATDVLSEGLNLQQASVVVHLDLPWNPARLEQRVGRAARMGSEHDAVTVYLVEPPAGAERVLSIQERLRRKLRAAGETVGTGVPVLPLLLIGERPPPRAGASDAHKVGGAPEGAAAPHPRTGQEPDAAGNAELLTALHRRVAHWGRGIEPGELASPAPVVAAVSAPATGYFAAVRLGGAVHLVANLGAGLCATPDILCRAAAFAEGPAVEPPAAGEVLHEIREWMMVQRGSRAVGLSRDPRLLRRVLHRIESIAASAPRHRRMEIAGVAHVARGVVTGALNAGAERALAELEYSHLADGEWLGAVAALAIDDPSGEAGGDALLAVILFTPAPPDAPTICTSNVVPPTTSGTSAVRRAGFFEPLLPGTTFPCTGNDSLRLPWSRSRPAAVPCPKPRPWMWA